MTYRRILAVLLLAGFPQGLAASPALDSLLACMRANIPQTLRIQSFELVSVDRGGGERRLQGRLYGQREQDLLRVMLRLEAPTDLRGAAYLLREADPASDEMYVFLPALNKVRRVAGGTRDNGLFGTDFSYNDLKQIHHAFAGGEMRLLAPQTLDGRPVQLLDLRPGAAADTRFDQIQAWVDSASCVALKIEFSRAGKLHKRLRAPAAELRQSGPHWYAGSALMEDLEAGTQTRLRITGVVSGEDLAGRYFNPRMFHIGN